MHFVLRAVSLVIIASTYLFMHVLRTKLQLFTLHDVAFIFY